MNVSHSHIPAPVAAPSALPAVSVLPAQSVPRSLPLAAPGGPGSYAASLTDGGQFNLDEIINILSVCTPNTPEDYAEHLFKVASLLQDDILQQQYAKLELKYYALMDLLPRFIAQEEPVHLKLYIVVEKCFDVFIRILTNHRNMALATRTIRFLTSIVMNLNYWEVYNLLLWKPSLHRFLLVIHFDLDDCYARFIKDYARFNYKQLLMPKAAIARAEAARRLRRHRLSELDGASDSEVDSNDEDSLSNTASSVFLLGGGSAEDHDRFVAESLAGLSSKEKKKIRVDAKIAAHRIIKKTSTAAAKPSNKSSNYDPDVVHECQLPSADEPHKLCLRRFSRKYELIRHQETVHSKKKKLFKCYVCVKQNPEVGPRIFTRHDTLAKHIRVNHKISGKEAKAEVAYSKKHAEVVEEGDITVHVGRRKTKVDFELRAHMEKKKKDGEIYDDIDSGNDFDSDEEILENEHSINGNMIDGPIVSDQAPGDIVEGPSHNVHADYPHEPPSSGVSGPNGPPPNSHPVSGGSQSGPLHGVPHSGPPYSGPPQRPAGYENAVNNANYVGQPAIYGALQGEPNSQYSGQPTGNPPPATS